MPKVSIIIPVHNTARYLEKCVASVTAQTLTDTEIILVENASTDNSLELCYQLALTDKRIRVLHIDEADLSTARNAGVGKASGEYVGFVDSDDTLIPGSEYRQCIEKLHSEMPQVLQFNYRTIAEGDRPNAKNKKRITFSNTISGGTYMKEFNLSGSPCRYFVRRELLMEKNIRFPENIFHEDEEFNTILHFHARSLVYSNATIYDYRIR